MTSKNSFLASIKEDNKRRLWLWLSGAFLFVIFAPLLFLVLIAGIDEQYYLINYGGEYRYFTDGEFNPIKVEGISDSGKNIILDYLRYTFKKQYPERYYNADFLRSLNIDSIDFEEIEFDIDGENLSCYLKDYDLSLEIPLKYVQKEIGMNFGFPYEIYSKPVYLSDGKEHPIICLTFDDGPKLWTDEDLTSTERILDLLYEYDAAGTFYVVGNALEDREIWADYQVYTMLKRSINHGNEYGWIYLWVPGYNISWR